MSVINKLIGVWFVNKTVSSTTPLLMRLLVGMAAISMVTIFTAFLGALIFGTSVWLVYQGLVAQGMTTPNAIFLIGTFLVAVFFLLMMVLQYYWRKVTGTFRQIVTLQSPVGGRMNSLLDSFLSGFHSRDVK